MAKKTRRFLCQNCGQGSAQWAGKCGACGAWNTLREEETGGTHGALLTRGWGSSLGSSSKLSSLSLSSLSGDHPQPPRIVTGMQEFDRVTGGGFVPGAVILVGGEPGIGKSTLLLQVAAILALQGTSTAYLSGEEALEQIRLRAQRLGLQQAPVELACATCLETLLETLAQRRPALAVIDSLQTLWSQAVEAAPGSVTQLRACVHGLIDLAKKTGIALVIVGHVTKDGQIAGPRVVEHMVDAVLYFEGDGLHHCRILRGIKNRFGATDEIGVFEMGAEGLEEVTNPSALFLGERDHTASGACVFAGIEGSRPLLIEIQALVAPAPFSPPRRAVIGWDTNRLSMILAVLETRCKIPCARYDVYLNVAGGLRIREPAADLAVAAALLSSLTERALPSGCVVFGEIGLSGTVRSVPRAAARLKEAHKLGFETALVPVQKGKGNASESAVPSLHAVNLIQREVAHLRDLVAYIGAPARCPGSEPESVETL